MPSKYNMIVDLAAATTREITSGAEPYMNFLTTAAFNFKYRYQDQLLIYAQKPEATACAEIGFWNAYGRWVNRGARGIALLVEGNSRNRLRHVFDVSDTNSEAGREAPIWTMQPRYEASVIEDLENSYGVDGGMDLPDCLVATAKTVVEDNYSDYLTDLMEARVGSLFESLDKQSAAEWFKTMLRNSVAFMLLTRCDINAWGRFTTDDFYGITAFNTPETMSILGAATSDISEMVLREIASTVRSQQREEQKRNRTFANRDASGYDGVTNKNNERGTHHGSDLQNRRGLSSAQPDRAGGSEGRQIWDAAARLPAETEERPLHGDAPQREAGETSHGGGPSGNRNGGEPDREDGKRPRRDGGAEGRGSDALGGPDEQHPGLGGGSGDEGAGVRLTSQPEEDKTALPDHSEARLWDLYNTVKQGHPDDIVLFQVGDFFEMFGEDAKQAAESLDLILFSRDIPNVGRVPMCGVPAHSLERYSEKLRAKYNVTFVAVDGKTGERGVYTLRAYEQKTEAIQPDVDSQLTQYKAQVIAAVAEDTAYRNACGNSDRENAGIECNAAVRRAVLNSGDIQLIKVFSDVPKFRERLHQEVFGETYPQLHELLRPLSQDDIDAVLREWNGNSVSRQRVAQYMAGHGGDENAAEWLAREYGSTGENDLIAVRVESPEGTRLPWEDVRSRIARLVQEGTFLTESIDPASFELRGVGPTGLQFMGFDPTLSDTPFYGDVAEKNELLRNSDAMKDHWEEIAAFFTAHEDNTERGDFIKAFFDNTLIESFLSNGQRAGYRAWDNALMIHRGSYMAPQKSAVMLWHEVATTIDAMIKQGQWLDAGEKLLPTEEEQKQAIKRMGKKRDSQQLSIFDMADSDGTVTPGEGPSLLDANFDLPQQIIDEALCIGSNEENSRLIICAWFMKDKPLAENADFLREHYRENGAGFYFGDRKYSLWYNRDGIRIDVGESAQSYTATVVSWEKAAKRIRELLDLGRYMPQSELDRAPEYEKDRLADSVSLMYRGIDGNDADAHFKSIRQLSEPQFGFPEVRELIRAMLDKPDSLQTLIAECNDFCNSYSRGLVSSHIGDSPRSILQRLEDLQLEPHIFTAAEGYNPQRRFFISGDELDRAIRGSTGYRLDIYSFYCNHPDQKDRENYLKNYHGEYTGNYGGNDNLTYTSKGFQFSHGSISEPYAKVELSWNKVEKRISDMIASGKFISEKDRAAMPTYERRQLAENIQAFFDLVPQDQPKPYPYGAHYSEAIREIESQLDDPAKVEAIHQMMIPIMESTPQDDHDYQLRKRGFENLTAFRNGTYSLFGGVREPNPIHSVTGGNVEQSQDGSSPAENELDKAKRLIDEFCENEYGSPGNFTDLTSVPVAYTTLTDDEIPAQINVDLVNFRMNSYLNDVLVGSTQYASLAELIQMELEGLSFDDLVYFTREQYEKAGVKTLEDDFSDVDPAAVREALAENGIVDGEVVDPEALAGDPLIQSVRAEVMEVAGDGREEQAEKAELPPPAPRPRREKLPPTVIHPEIPSVQRHDFRITDDDLGVGTPSERYARNVAAIRLLKQLEGKGRLATPEEQTVLSQYVGWGGLADCFDDRNSHYEELKSLLSENEYAAARESSLTAFYTPPVVIRAMYQTLENLSFKTGNVLEPSCGVGNFIGMKPESLAEAKIYGVELDSISGRIAQQLYQTSSIAVQGFEKTELPDSFFDVAIGNVPFGSFKVPDRRYDKYNFLIHDYFFARTLDKVRPGGVVAFITSKGTLDKENPNVRRYIAQRADLLGAIRLPNNTFKAAAGTEVTSDILFLQKRESLAYEEPAWVHLNTDANGIKMNQYFIDNPDMVLGNMREVSGPFGPETACLPHEGADLDTELAEAIENINGNIAEYVMDDPEAEVSSAIPADPSVKNFSYTIVDGQIYYRENSVMNPVEVSVTAQGRIKGLIGIRDCVRTLIDYQTDDYPESDIKEQQERLNKLYDTFVEKYGRINSRANSSAFSMDSAYFLLTSLEILDDEQNFVRKADMFTKRTIRQRVVVTSVDTASEALTVSLAEKAGVDLSFMASLMGGSEKIPQVVEDLKGVIFKDPLTGSFDMEAADGSWAQGLQTADEYLSGNVRVKLKEARQAAEIDPDFTVNVTALEAVQPVDLSASEISVRLGATWLPTEIVEKFMYELLSTPPYLKRSIRVHYSKHTGEWSVEGKSNDRINLKANNTYGTGRINAYKIIETTLNLRDVRIFDYVYDDEGRKTPVLNKRETAIAQGKQELIKQAFQDWIWKDPNRREGLCRLYNDRFNSVRPREYDGSHINFVGMSPEITLRPHQVNAIAHILYGGNTLLAHVVGAGKTYEMVAAAMESKRLGLCQKSLIVVPNHLTEQWASEWLQLYPSANILVATKKDFETKNRKRFCGRIATGDYDAIIIGHSQFEKIPMSVGRQRFILEQEREEILNGIAELKEHRGERFTIKQMEKSKKSIEAKLDKLNDQSRKDDVVTFEELGVDRLFVDEAHYFKNLAAFSKMRNVGGISQTEAQKSSDLYMKCRYLDELTGGKGVIFATGTPISNTMLEMYTMQKYLQYGALSRNGLIHFDAWASTFGETVTAIELAPEGTGYRSKTRFSRFYNLPELMTMFKEIADIQTADMLSLPVPKANYHNIVLKPSEQQKQMVAALGERAERVRNKMVNSSEDNMLLITNDGRKLALDQRLLNPMLPDSDTGKVRACADNVFEIWQRTAGERSAQMVFCDLSIPKNDGSFNVYDDLRDKLIAMGIPAEEIAYVHNANTEVQKKELFGKVRSGQVRVLIGSTQKMGAGTNVQTRLIALHHLDCPWRPSDLQQREGRIIRQGNTNPEVDIYTYVTENTFDSYLYQLVEGKQKFIGQVMTSKSPVRSAEDIDETALSYAEIKALCTGDPRIKEKMDLDIDVQRLKLLKANHLSQKYALEDAIYKYLPQKIASCEQRIAGYEADKAHLAEHTHPNEDGFSPMEVKGAVYTDKKEAGSAILAAMQSMTSPDAVQIGQYRGFTMELSFDSFTRKYLMTLKNELSHVAELGADVFGNITRIDNILSGFEARLAACRDELENVKVQLANAKVDAEKPFPQEEELTTKSARLDELNIQLNLDKHESEIVDEDREDGENGTPVRDSTDLER